MTDEFGKAGDPGQEGFTQGSTETITVENMGGIDITPGELAELRKRDVNAQEHIPRLEDENAQLRSRMAEIEAQLEGSATMQDVLNRIENRSEDGVTLDADAVAQQVEQRLHAKAMEEAQSTNWEKVLGQLKEHHGSLEQVDQHVATKAKELGMDLTEATQLAKRSPDAFMKLYAAEGSVAPQQGSASAAGQQTSLTTPHGEVRDKAYYDKMLRENPKKYWKVDTQAALRRDVYGWG
jgi:chromosome segregation ATPase